MSFSTRSTLPWTSPGLVSLSTPLPLSLALVIAQLPLYLALVAMERWRGRELAGGRVSSLLQLPILGGYGYIGQEIHHTAGLSLAVPPRPLPSHMYLLVLYIPYLTYTYRPGRRYPQKLVELFFFSLLPLLGSLVPLTITTTSVAPLGARSTCIRAYLYHIFQYIQCCTHGLRVRI